MSGQRQGNLVAAAAYTGMEYQPDHAYVQLSYAVFKRTVKRQWDELREGGIEFRESATDPYAGSRMMRREVEEHQRLYVFTDHGASLPDDHPMKEYVESGVPGFVVYNDIFRGVHDVLGHVAAGSTFGPVGEEAAWQAHRRTMPSLALNALWCETRGQAAWTNFAEDHADRPLAERPFPDQKAGVVVAAIV